MASGRFLSTSVAEDDRLSKLSMAAELLYLKTIPHLDRDGMISGKAGLLWGKVCPLREELISEMQRAIDSWVQVGLVVRMITDEGPVLFFPGFLKNNNLPHYHRERPSRYPVPTGYVRTDSGLILEGTEPPKKQSKKTQPPPSSNGNAESVQDEVQESINDEVLDKFMDEINDEVLDFDLQEQEEDQEEEEDQDHSIRAHDEEPATPKEQTLSEQVFDRLEEEWSIVNPGQMDKHMELAGKYGYDAWVAGMERCAKGKRSIQSYVEKAICSAIDERPSLAKAKPKLPPAYKYIITDPVTGVRKEVLM